MAKDGAGEFMEKTLEKPVSIDFEKADGDSMLTKEDVKDMIMDIVEGKVNATKEEVADFKADVIDKPITVNITELPKVRAGWVCPWGVGFSISPRGDRKHETQRDGWTENWISGAPPSQPSLLSPTLSHPRTPLPPSSSSPTPT